MWCTETDELAEKRFFAEYSNKVSHGYKTQLTANAMDGARERCLAAGMDDYIAKHFKPNQLQAFLNLWARPPR